jgi:benzoyl-CoA 2,3-dioxygenase component A
MALTVKRLPLSRDSHGRMRGIASNWLCDLRQGDAVEVTGPYGATFLMPDDSDADLLMICTGTGVSPFRGFTHRRRRAAPNARGKLHLVFGARSPEELPYFGPLQNYQKSQLDCDLVYSRQTGRPKEYVQDRLRARAEDISTLLRRETTHVYICGLSGLERGVEDAFGEIGRGHGFDWPSLRAGMREAGRFHIETY